VCWRRLSPRRLGTQVGRVAFKRRATPLEGNHVFALPSCIVSFHLPSPQMGDARNPSILSLEEHDFVEVGTFQPSSASRIFIMQPGRIPSPVVTQDGDLQLDGGEKRTGLRPLPLPQLQGCSSSVLGRGVCRVGVGPCAGGGSLLPSVIGGKGVRRSWCWQLPRAWLSEPGDFGATPGAAFRHGNRKRFLCRRASRCHPRTDL
jgi:hypothetical protein